MAGAALGVRASVVAWHTGLVAPQHVASPQTQGVEPRSPCIGRLILDHGRPRTLFLLKE